VSHLSFLLARNATQRPDGGHLWSCCFVVVIVIIPIRFTSLHFTSLHFTSLRFTSLHFTSLRFTSLRFTSLHFTSLHFTSLHFASLRFTSLHFTSLHFTSLFVCLVRLVRSLRFVRSTCSLWQHHYARIGCHIHPPIHSATATSTAVCLFHVNAHLDVRSLSTR